MRALYIISALALLSNGAIAQENKKINIKEAIANKNIIATLDKNDAIFANDKSSFEIYRLNAKAGQIISLVLNSSEFRPIIEIGNINGAQLCPECNFAGADGQNNANIKYEVLEDGPVFIRVSNNEAGTFGKYSLDIKLIKPPVSNIPKLTIGKALIGKIDGTEKPNTDGEGFDSYEIKLKAGEYLQADLISKDFDPYLEIFGPKVDGEVFFKNDDMNGEGKNARIVFKAPVNGNYIFNVYSNNKNGEYSLKLGAPTKINFPNSQNIDINKTISGKLTEQTIDYREGDMFFALRYKVKLQAGKKYWISAKSNDFDPRIEIGTLDADNNIKFIDSDEDSGNDNDALILFDAQNDNEYIVRVTHLLSDEDYPLTLSETTGNFELLIKEALVHPHSKNGKPVKAGELIKGEFKDGMPRAWNYFLEDFYEIDLKKDQRIEAQLSPFDENSKIVPFVSVGKGDEIANFEPLGDSYYKDAEAGAIIRFKAVEDGKYLIRIQNEDLNIEGQYKLKITALPDNSKEIAPRKINIGEEITSSLDLNDKSDGLLDLPYELYVFDAIAGQSYEITQKSEVFDSVFGLKPQNDTGAFVNYDEEVGSYYNAQANFTAKVTGPYLIKASALNGNEIGEYKLKIIKK